MKVLVKRCSDLEVMLSWWYALIGKDDLGQNKYIQIWHNLVFANGEITTLTES